ncbi:hypothetical protein D3C80_1635170 [compost metagenome]
MAPLDTGVVNQHIDPTALRLNFLNSGMNGLGVSDIKGRGIGAEALTAQCFNGSLGVFFGGRIDQYVSAVLRQPTRQQKTNAPRSAGNQYFFIIQ